MRASSNYTTVPSRKPAARSWSTGSTTRRRQNFDAEVDEVVEAEPDAVVVIGFDESSRILTGLFEQGITPDQIYLVDGNIGNALGEDFTGRGALVGAQGTQPAAEITEEFKNQLLGVDPGLIDYNYGPETYDAVVIAALAAELAGTDDPAQIATFINGVTREGEKCATFAECKALIEGGATDIDYDGPSGPAELLAGRRAHRGELLDLDLRRPNNTIDAEATQFRTASF